MTVESKQSKANNVFGSVGFIGVSEEFGEQWLYSRPDFTRMSELFDKRISRAVLHIPYRNNTAIDLVAYRLSSRFCGFGLLWEIKIAAASFLANGQQRNGYLDIDLTSLVSDCYGRFAHSEGFLLKTEKKKMVSP